MHHLAFTRSDQTNISLSILKAYDNHAVFLELDLYTIDQWFNKVDLTSKFSNFAFIVVQRTFSVRLLLSTCSRS